MGREPTEARAFAIGVIVTSALGGFAAALLGGTPVPASSDLMAAPAPMWAPVTLTSFGDESDAQLSPVLEPRPDSVVGIDGIVTRYACEPGNSLHSPSRPIDIDGVPITAVHSPFPWWRDVAVGDTGKDVYEWRTLLREFGFEVALEGPVDEALVAESEEFLDTELERRIPLTSQVVWLPAAEVEIRGCPAHLGARVTQGSSVFAFRDRLVLAEVARESVSVVEGEREFVLGGATLAVSPRGAIEDSELDLLQELPEFRAWIEADGAIPLVGTLRLAVPIEAAVVPLGALVESGDPETLACVSTDDGIQRVDVLGSSLGRAYIRFSGSASSEVELGGDFICP